MKGDAMMHARTKVFLASGFAGAITIGTLAPANAQYYPPPGYGDDYGYRYPSALVASSSFI
jgi:hypothetical protein